VTATSPELVTRAIERAAALLGADPRGAEQEARAALAHAPKDPRGALILASALRRQGDNAGALAILAPLARAFPNAALTQYELGLALAATGDSRGAEAALRRAVALNRDHAEAWRALGDLLFKQGDARGSEIAFAQHRRALVRDPRLKPAAEAIWAGGLEEAEQRLRRELAAHPDDTAALQMLAEVFSRQNRHAASEALLARSLALDPTLGGARFSLANALFRQQKGAEAMAHLEPLLALEADNPAYRNLAAACLELLGDYDRALELYEGALGAFERQPLLWINYGHVLRTVGRRDDAAAAYRRAIVLDAAAGEAYLGLANLRLALAPAEVEALRRAAACDDLPRKDRAHLAFALGRSLEGGGDDGEAFASYAAGAALRRAETPYDAAGFTAYVQACAKVWTADFFAARAEFGVEAEDPIFIVGLHRSGSTLIEQILASHSAVEGTLELPDIGFAARRLGWSEGMAAPYPASTARLTPADAAAMGAAYLKATAVNRKLGRRFFVDKMPNNFQHLGLIQLMLPRAKIIDARRHPLGACFSAFKQHFADAQPFTYDLADLGRYYRDYVALMAHFDAVLPGRVHRVIYEDLVADTEGEVRRLLGYCGLDFEPACLEFHRNDRPVRTVSSEQVRQPIYRQGVDNWRRFEAWLGPLKDALGPALTEWRGEAAPSASP
jgi:tetratricopeptide (TPR) repeat protein